MSKRAVLLLSSFFAFIPAASQANVTFSGSSGSLAASVSFDLIGGALQVILTNTSGTAAAVPADVLTAVYFNITGNPALSRTSAISNGSTYDGTTLVSAPGTTVGGEWAYLNNLSAYGANSGISSSGLGIFGPTDLFPGPNLAGPVDPDGLQYGLTSANGPHTTGNPMVTGTPLTNHGVTFLLGVPTGFSLASISNITFQYGTNSSEPSFGGGGGSNGGGGGNGVPEPETVALLGAGLSLLALARRRRR